MVVLVSGSSGNVGRLVMDRLAAAGAQVRRAERTRPAGAPGPIGSVRFDCADASTWGPAFADVETMFLVRSPALGNVRRDLLPAVSAARASGVRSVVFLSLQGAARIPVVPRAAVESWLRSSGLAAELIDDVLRVTGRRPRTVRETLQRDAAASRRPAAASSGSQGVRP